jgi:pilus assembly protein CpaC
VRVPTHHLQSPAQGKRGTRNLLKWALAIWLGLSSSFAWGQALRHMDLHVGAVKTLPVGEVEKVAVGNEEVLSVSTLDTGELLLIPRQAGESDLFVWKPGLRMQRYRINVIGMNPNRRLATINSVLSGFPGVQARAVDGLIVVEGELDPSLMPLYERIVDGMPGALSLVRPAEVPERDLIRIKVQVIEVDEQYRKRIGIRWADAMEGPTVAAVGTLVRNDFYRIVPSGGSVDWSELLEDLPARNRGFHPFVGFSSALLSTIQLMEQNGVARTLAEPVLTTRSGEVASFLSGGEIPYQIVDQLGNLTTSFKEYGIGLEIQPTADRNGNIMSRVLTEVSSPDLSTAIGNVPALLTRRTESVISARSGETLVISGLLTVQDSNGANKVPGLGSIPLLGGLFRSNEKSEMRRELVILVTPEISSVGPAPAHMAAHADQLRALRGDGKSGPQLRE